MIRKIYIIPLLFCVLKAQISISDINQIGNQRLDEIRNELISQQDNILNEKEKADDVESIPIEIVNNNSNKTENKYFGYNYFQSDINFFDNIPTPADFKLGAGDEIILSLWGETNSREKFIINKEGLIYYENVGFINLSNKTVDEAESLLVKELSKIYSTLKDNENSTRLMIELGKLKSLNIYFSGEIAKPGVQLVHPFSDIFVALVQAGGVNIEGSLRKIQLIRDGKIIALVDFYNFFSNGVNDFSDLRLIDGDIIYVPAIENRVEIQGAVLRPGFFEILKSEGLNDLIKYAAGLTPKASSNVTIDTVKPITDRKSQDDIISSMNIDIINEKVSMNNGDLVLVREVGNSPSKVEIFGRVKVPGKYSATGMSLKNVLDIAGGFDDPVFRKTIREDIVILRKDENKFYSTEINVNYKDADSFPLKIDDKIFVYEDINYRNSFTFRVEGEVNKPGTYPLKKGITMMDAINMAGGLTQLTTYENIVVIQEFSEINEQGNESLTTQKVSSVSKDFELSQNSVIKAIPFENVVKVEGNVYNPGLVAFEKGLTMHGAIVQAGGYKPDSLLKRSYVKRANGEVDKASIFRGRTKRLKPGDTVFVPLNPDPSDFDLTIFLADLSSTLANIAAILLIVDNQKD
tara:strand:- start:819 stop:2720 length:1902 start_codon:yes stop_codon:yes gene_type:complete